MAVVMKADDTISASLAECFVTIEGNRYNFMQAKSIEAKFEKNKVEVPLLGQTGKGNKANGWKGTGSATFYFSTSVFRKLFVEYKNTGKDVYFDMQITNEDPSSAAGRQTILLKRCNLNGGILTKFDITSDSLDESMDFTFEDFDMPEEFTLLDGMRI